MCRVVKGARITSPYNVEEYSKEINYLKGIDLDCILAPSYIHIREKEIYILYQRKLSLHDYLNPHPRQTEEHERIITDDIRLKLAKNIAEAMKELYALDPPLYHGHLTPKNIFISNINRLTVQIGDVGDGSLRRHAAIFNGYDSRSVFSSPEVLESGFQQEGGSEAHDIFSYGIILWEIWSEMVPFNDSTPTAVEYVLNGESRPKIPANTPENIKQLIRECWKQTDRTITFRQICKNNWF